MSEKVDKRKLVSPERLEHMKAMRQALAEKNKQKKEAKLNPPEPIVPEKVEPVQEQVEEDEEEEVEVPVPVKKVKSKSPVYSNYSIQDEIYRYVQEALPPELRKESLKQKKWEIRRNQLRDEILQSLQPTPQPSEAPKINVAKTATLELKDLFYSPYE